MFTYRAIEEFKFNSFINFFIVLITSIIYLKIILRPIRIRICFWKKLDWWVRDNYWQRFLPLEVQGYMFVNKDKTLRFFK